MAKTKSEDSQTFREALKGYVGQNGLSFDALPTEAAKSLWMTRFYVTQVFGKLNPGLLPSDASDLEAAITDAPRDLGIDFIWTANDESVVVIQTKYHGNKQREERAEACETFRGVLGTIDAALQGKRRSNSRLLSALTDVDLSAHHFVLHFVSLAPLPAQIANDTYWQSAAAVHGVEDLNDRTDIRFLGETELNAEWKRARSVGSAGVALAKILFSSDDDGNSVLVHSPARSRKSVVGLVSGSQIAELYKPNREAIFKDNIREDLGNTTTNRAIAATAYDRAPDFFFFNNGVSATATSIDPDPHVPGAVVCRDFSIVNGAQTVRSIFSAYCKRPDGPERVRDLRVLLRITLVSLADRGESFLDDVARFNNTQNVIKIADFRSTDPVQRSLKERFSTLPARESKRFQYKNKRGSADRRVIEIPMEEFAKTIFAFQFGPSDLFGGTKFLFNADQGGGYSQIFGDGRVPWVEVTDADFRRLAGTWFVCEFIRAEAERRKLELGTRAQIAAERLATARLDSAGHDPRLLPLEADARRMQSAVAALERRWWCFYAVGELLRSAHQDDAERLSTWLRKLSNPGWTVEDKGATGSLLREYSDAAMEVLADAYEDAASRPTEFKHRNWFRSEATRSAVARLAARAARHLKRPS